MNTTIITLLAGFAGSLVTLIITKLIDSWQSKQQREFDLKKDDSDFERELKKQFFARKLEVAEDFIKALTQLSASCQGGAQIYNSIRQGNVMTDLESGKAMTEQTQQNYQSAMKSYNEKGSIIDLYFEFEVNPLLDVVARNQGLPMRFEMCTRDAMLLWNEAQKKQENKEADADEKSETAKQKFDEMFSLAEQLEQMYYDMSNACGQLIVGLQTKMKKFDY